MKKIKIYWLDTNDVSLETLLGSPYAKESFENYKVEESRKEKIASSILKNKYIGNYHLNEFGKPLSETKSFNVSHSKGVVALAIDSSPIGIDIEKIREVNESLISHISNEEEKKYIHDEKSFFEIWTNKEAVVKAQGKGLSSKVKDLPGLPLNSIRLYQDKSYCNKTIEYQGYVITISREDLEDFELVIIHENI